MKRGLFIVIFLASISSAVFAVIPLIGFGASAVAQQVVRTTSFKLIQRGFNPADPRFSATTGAIVSVFSSRLKTQASLGLAAVVGFTIINNDNGLTIQSANGEYTLNYAGQNQIEIGGVLYSSNSDIPNSAFDSSFFSDSPCSGQCRYVAGSYSSDGVTISQQHFSSDGFGGGNWNYSGQHRFIPYANSTPYSIGQPASLPTPSDLPDQVGSISIPDNAFADLVNDLWSEAANQTGYSGIPPSFSNQVTVDDVSASINQSGGARVTVRDILTPVQIDSSGNPVIDVNLTDGSATQHAPGTNNNTQNETAPEIADPSIAEPNILPLIQPFLNLKDRYSIDFQSNQGACPSLEFNVVGIYFGTTAHCQIFETIKPSIALFMLIFWTFIGFRIVMDA